MKFILLFIFFEIYNFLNLNTEIEIGELIEFSSSDEDVIEAKYEGKKPEGYFIINNQKDYNYMSMIIDFENLENLKMEYNIINNKLHNLEGSIFNHGSILVPFQFYNNSNITFSFNCLIDCVFKIKFIFNNTGYMSNNILHSVIYMEETFNKTLEFIYEPIEKEENQNYLITITTTNIDDISMEIVDDENNKYEIQRSELFYTHFSLLNNSFTNYSIIITDNNTDNLELRIINTNLELTKFHFKNDFVFYNYINSNGNQSCNTIEGTNRWQIRALSDYPLEIYLNNNEDFNYFSDISKKYITSNNNMTVIQEYNEHSVICLNKINNDSLIIIQVLDVSSNEYSNNYLDPLFINVTNPDLLDPNGVKYYSFEPYDFKNYFNYTFKVTNTTGNINAYIYSCNKLECNISASIIDDLIEKNKIQILKYEENYFKYSENEYDFSKDKKLFIRCEKDENCEYIVTLEEQQFAITSGQTYVLNETDETLEYAFVGNSNSDYFYLEANGDSEYLTIYIEHQQSLEERIKIYYNIYEENNEDKSEYKGIIHDKGSLILPHDFYNNKKLRINLFSKDLIQIKLITFFDDTAYIKDCYYSEFLFIKEFNKTLNIIYNSTNHYLLYIKSLKKNDKFKAYINDNEMNYTPYLNMYFTEVYYTQDLDSLRIESEDNDYLILSIIPHSYYNPIFVNTFDINLSLAKLIKPNENFNLMLINSNNYTYQIIIQTNNSLNYSCDDETEEIKNNSRIVFEYFDTFLSYINITSDNYSIIQIQFIKDEKQNNSESILSPLIINACNEDILRENEIRYFSIQYLDDKIAEDLYNFTINENSNNLIKAYVHKCEDYPLCIYNKTYIESLIQNKDENLIIFNEKSKGNLFCEIEKSKLSLKNVLIVECGNEECFYNINIENIKREKKDDDDDDNTKTIIIIMVIIVIVLIVVIILLMRYFKRSSNDNKMIEKINDIGEIKK
jgi:hypothetical protein